MAFFKPTGMRAAMQVPLSRGDTYMTPANFTSDATAAGITIPAAKLVSGYFRRTGPAGGFTDIFDTAINIYNALIGEGSDPEIANGDAFVLRYVNAVAQLATITLGGGMVAGSGTVASVTASTWREFLFTFLSVQKPLTVLGTTTNGNTAVTLALQPGQNASLIGPSPNAANITPGAFISGTGIAAATTVAGLTMGQGGLLGFTLSQNATASGTVALQLGPYIQVDGPGSGTL